MQPPKVLQVKSEKASTLLAPVQPKEKSETNNNSILVCPDCGGKNFRRQGKTKAGHQGYLCKECGRHITDNPQKPPQPTPPTPIAPNLHCPDCGGKNFKRQGKSKTGYQEYRCRGCGRNITDNPQRPPQPKPPTPIPPDLHCRHCGAERLVKIGKRSSRNQVYQCKECKGYTTPDGHIPEIITGIPCPECKSENIRKRQITLTGYQQYECKDCYKNFTPDTPRGKIPPGLICPRCAGTGFQKWGVSKTGKPSFKCKKCNRMYTPNAENPFIEYVPNSDLQAEYTKDIWDFRNLGLDINKAYSVYTVNFTDILQPWLREATKQYIRYSLATISINTSLNKLTGMRRLSTFFAEYYPMIIPSEISRSVVTNFFSYLVSKKLSASTRVSNISTVKVFFELCNRNNWLDLSAKPVIYGDDFPKASKHTPRYIPQEVLNQLNLHLDALPEPVMRMVLVLQECGMRISELLLLSFNCLIQDGQGDWFLRYYQSKMKKELVIPISREIVAVIQEQQRYIRENLGLEFEYLFCANRGTSKPGFIAKNKPMSVSSFPAYLNRVAEKKNICDASGNLWRFEVHQFRHTVATRMINNGVPLHIVQRFLGHDVITMTARYAHINDQTLKKQIAMFQGKIVNVVGQVIETENSEHDMADLQWFKRNILAQALPNGSCALPTITQGCPHANACLTCTHFRTTNEFLDQHKAQLEQTEQMIEKAKANNWVRQVEMNEQVANNLRNIVSSLEVGNGN